MGVSLRIAGLAVATIGLWSCTVQVDEPRPRPPYPGPPICTREYSPVCGERYGDRQTFANSCLARADGYRIVYRGECRRDRPDRPHWPRPGKPDDRPNWPARPPERPGRPGSSGDSGTTQFCTKQYQPVCARRGGDYRTFGNSCEAEAAGWRVTSSGRC